MSERVIPASEEAEKGVLSCMLQSVEILRKAATDLSQEAFYSPARQAIFTAMVELDGGGKPVDHITLVNHLRDRNNLERAGGAFALADLGTSAPAPAHYEHYRAILGEKWALRSLASVAITIERQAMTGEGDAKTILEAADRELTAIHRSMGNDRVHRTRHIAKILAECVEEVSEWQAGTRSPGISTGLAPFDRKQLLLRAGGYFVVAAPTNTGKSTMLSQIILAAIAKGHKVSLASVEDSDRMFGHRMSAHRSRVSFSRMTQEKSLSTYDFQKYTRAVGDLAQENLRILHNGGMTTDEFRHWARRQVLDFGAEIIALDYLQKLRPVTKRGQNTFTDAVVEASDTVKELANDLGACFLISVQTNRMRGRKATIDDLKQSGQIAQDATEVMILQRVSDIESRGDEEEQEKPERDANVSVGVETLATIAKQKNGGHSEHVLYLFGDIFRFEEPARTHESND